MHSSEGQSHKHSIVLLQWTLFHFLVTMCVCFVNVPVLWAKLAMSTRFRIIWTRSKSPLFRLYNTVQTEGHRRSIYPKYPESLIVQTAHRPNPSVLFAIYIYIYIYIYCMCSLMCFSAHSAGTSLNPGVQQASGTASATSSPWTSPVRRSVMEGYLILDVFFLF